MPRIFPIPSISADVLVRSVAANFQPWQNQTKDAQKCYPWHTWRAQTKIAAVYLIAFAMWEKNP